ncbi:MAG: hypothetical protein ACLQG3_13525 [Terracidiphilus sp.]
MKRNLSLLAAVFAMSVTMAMAAGSTNVTGWISDSMCGAKHLGDNPECVKKCIAGGMKPVFVDADKQVWAIDNPDAVKSEFYGAKVTVTATEDTSAKSVHIESIAAAK